MAGPAIACWHAKHVRAPCHPHDTTRPSSALALFKQLYEQKLRTGAEGVAAVDWLVLVLVPPDDDGGCC
jgi:hypothetical protein